MPAWFSKRWPGVTFSPCLLNRLFVFHVFIFWLLAGLFLCIFLLLGSVFWFYSTFYAIDCVPQTFWPSEVANFLFFSPLFSALFYSPLRNEGLPRFAEHNLDVIDNDQSDTCLPSSATSWLGWFFFMDIYINRPLSMGSSVYVFMSAYFSLLKSTGYTSWSGMTRAMCPFTKNNLGSSAEPEVHIPSLTTQFCT